MPRDQFVSSSFAFAIVTNHSLLPHITQFQDGFTLLLRPLAEIIRTRQCPWRGHHQIQAQVAFLTTHAHADPLHLVKKVVSCRRQLLSCDLMDELATQGYLAALEYLHATYPTLDYSIRALDGASLHGHLDVVEFLMAVRHMRVSSDAMILAAGANHVAILEYLHLVHQAPCTNAAIDRAAENGHLDAVQFLVHRQSLEGRSNDAISGAARHGHAAVVRFLLEHGFLCLSIAWVHAAHYGHLAVLAHLCELRPESFHPSAIDEATCRGHDAVAAYLVDFMAGRTA
ncbi:Aste57867_1692 [Aphanomyces stellatus]|uniref:Aste57867_1692 protein n=1 Tax=Aphanomyces stellatus TaxID=120398 RepID=A0A485K6V2_9STRA|nr:hypothetical protein As57867_001690 [Aphanomyces stellatus]VFT78903.1 Aste57867_1692 [Aphanomyces stellatus]